MSRIIQFGQVLPRPYADHCDARLHVEAAADPILREVRAPHCRSAEIGPIEKEIRIAAVIRRMAVLGEQTETVRNGRLHEHILDAAAELIVRADSLGAVIELTRAEG